MPWTETVLHFRLALLKQNVRGSIYWLQEPFIPWICLGQKCLKLITRGQLLFQIRSVVGLVWWSHRGEGLSLIFQSLWISLWFLGSTLQKIVLLVKEGCDWNHGASSSILMAFSSENILSWRRPTRIIKSNSAGSFCLLLPGTSGHWDIAAIFALCLSKPFSSCFHPSSVLRALFILLSLKNV